LTSKTEVLSENAQYNKQIEHKNFAKLFSSSVMTVFSSPPPSFHSFHDEVHAEFSNGRHSAS